MPRTRKVKKPNPFEKKLPQDSELKANKNFKDGLFRFIFGKNKEYALSLYNALNKTNYTDASELEFTTLKNAFMISVKEDVAFMFDNKMNLYEHQSTHCPNMPLRGLFYFANLYRKRIPNKDLFKPTAVRIPLPQYIVFYNGKRKEKAVDYLKLSDSFLVPDTKNHFEWTATVININKNNNKNLKSRCKILSDYSKMINKIQEYNCHDNLENAILKAIEYCIKHNILADFLEQHRWEVCYLGWTDLSEKEYEEAMQEVIDEANARANKAEAERDEAMFKIQSLETEIAMLRASLDEK